LVGVVENSGQIKVRSDPPRFLEPRAIDTSPAALEIVRNAAKILSATQLAEWGGTIFRLGVFNRAADLDILQSLSEFGDGPDRLSEFYRRQEGVVVRARELLSQFSMKQPSRHLRAVYWLTQSVGVLSGKDAQSVSAAVAKWLIDAEEEIDTATRLVALRTLVALPVTDAEVQIWDKHASALTDRAVLQMFIARLSNQTAKAKGGTIGALQDVLEKVISLRRRTALSLGQSAISCLIAHLARSSPMSDDAWQAGS
jgi:hypothetical protein